MGSQGIRIVTSQRFYLLNEKFLGVVRNAPIAALIGDMGWLPIETVTKINSIKFWFRLSNMADNRLNKQVFNEASN